MGTETDFLPYIYAMLVGFAIAGLVMTSFKLATGRVLGFALDDEVGAPLAVLAIVLRIVAGPAILVSNALASDDSSDWQPLIIVFCLAIAVCWSLLCGTIMIESLTGGFSMAAAQPA